MDDDEQRSLREWARKVVGLEKAVIESVLKSAKQLAADRRLSKSDRMFAEAQIQAINQARRKKSTE